MIYIVSKIDPYVFFYHIRFSSNKFLYIGLNYISNIHNLDLDDCLKSKQISVQGKDKYYTSLKTFRVLGAKKIVNAIAGICPGIKDDEVIVDIHYKLTFLEFMEILLVLAYDLDCANYYEKEEDTTHDEKRLVIVSASNIRDRKKKKGSYALEKEKDKMKNVKTKKKK